MVLILLDSNRSGIKPGALQTDINTLADRLDIVEACTQMAWLTDQRNWAGLIEVFADRVRLDYTSLNGGEPFELNREDVVATWAGLLGRLAATQHLVGNHLVSISGDVADCTATFQATHVYPNPYGDSLWTLGGDYRYELRRIDARWRIASITMTAKWATGNQHILTLVAEDEAAS